MSTKCCEDVLDLERGGVLASDSFSIQVHT